MGDGVSNDDVSNDDLGSEGVSSEGVSSEGVSSIAELAAVLRRVAELVARNDVDTTWSTYEPDELRSEIGSFLAKAEAGLELDEPDRGTLRVLFAPTGPLQETSVSSGWATEFLALAARFDEAI